jgi:hypothetical protein
VYDGVQVPPLQLFEQQSPASPHASPSVLQPLPPGSAAHVPPVHTPVQHSESAVHCAAFFLHAVPPHVPPSQSSVQHSPDEVQDAPADLQNELGAHSPPSQTAEQQSFATAQLAPVPPQVTDGDAQTLGLPDVSHRPEQQSASAAQLVAPRGAQVLDGFVQTPFAQAFVQQSLEVKQIPPSALQVSRATHWFPAQPRPEQHSDGSEQAPVAGTQAGTAQTVPAHSSPRQQSSVDMQDAVSAPQLAGAVQMPDVQLSAVLQHLTSVVHCPPVSAQMAGATHRPFSHVSAPQHGSTEQSAPVWAHVAGGVQ